MPVPVKTALGVFLFFLGLYGLTYAAWQSADSRLAQRVEYVFEHLPNEQPDYAKSFAMQFRNSQRAAALRPLVQAQTAKTRTPSK